MRRRRRPVEAFLIHQQLSAAWMKALNSPLGRCRHITAWWQVNPRPCDMTAFKVKESVLSLFGSWSRGKKFNIFYDSLCNTFLRVTVWGTLVISDSLWAGCEMGQSCHQIWLNLYSYTSVGHSVYSCVCNIIWVPMHRSHSWDIVWYCNNCPTYFQDESSGKMWKAEMTNKSNKSDLKRWDK